MRPLLIFAALLVAVPAWADLPVSYDVDYKTLRKSLLVGDPLSFELFETAECKDTGVFREVLSAGSAEVSVEQVDPVAARGEKPKPRKIARLRAALDVPALDAPLYLRVQGNGIEAVGGECQAQVAPAPEADCSIESGSLSIAAAAYPMEIDLDCFEETDEIVVVASGWHVSEALHRPFGLVATSSWETDHWVITMAVYDPDGGALPPTAPVYLSWIATLKTVE